MEFTGNNRGRRQEFCRGRLKKGSIQPPGGTALQTGLGKPQFRVFLPLIRVNTACDGVGHSCAGQVEALKDWRKR